MIIRFIENVDVDKPMAEEMQELTVKLSQSVTFIMIIFSVPLLGHLHYLPIVLSVWHLALKMLLWKSYRIFEKANLLGSAFLKTSQRNDSVTILKLNVFGEG